MLSVLVSTNNTTHIEELFKTIDTQNYMPEYEVIVVIDGCKECKDHLLSIYKNFPAINLYDCPKNMGIYKSTNTLISLAEGDDLLFFGSDDLMLPNLVEEIYLQKEKHDADVVQFLYHDLRGKHYRVQRTKHHAAGALWMRKSVFKILGGYMPWRFSADTELVERIKSTNLKHIQVDLPLFLYRTWGDNLTTTVSMDARIKQRSKIKWHGYKQKELHINPIKNIGEWI